MDVPRTIQIQTYMLKIHMNTIYRFCRDYDELQLHQIVKQRL